MEVRSMRPDEALSDCLIESYMELVPARIRRERLGTDCPDAQRFKLMMEGIGEENGLFQNPDIHRQLDEAMSQGGTVAVMVVIRQLIRDAVETGETL